LRKYSRTTQPLNFFHSSLIIIHHGQKEVDIAKALNISWNTAQIHLLKLVNEEILNHRKVGRQNQFWFTKNYEKKFRKDL